MIQCVCHGINKQNVYGHIFASNTATTTFTNPYNNSCCCFIIKNQIILVRGFCTFFIVFNESEFGKYIIYKATEHKNNRRKKEGKIQRRCQMDCTLCTPLLAI